MKSSSIWLSTSSSVRLYQSPGQRSDFGYEQWRKKKENNSTDIYLVHELAESDHILVNVLRLEMKEILLSKSSKATPKITHHPRKPRSYSYPMP
jgi:hypothetical protein